LTWLEKMTLFARALVLTISFCGLTFTAPIVAQTNPSASDDACRIVLTLDDAPRFKVPEIIIPSQCSTFTVALDHIGRLPKSATGHNWVLVATPDLNAVTREGLKAGVTSHFVKPSDKRVLAHTPIIGGGEQAEVTFSTSILIPETTYTYLSTVDGQSANMRGVIRRP
jgi:azurin